MDAVEDIKSRLNIEDVIGEYVQLKRQGRNFKGLSPFTGEKSASFNVSPEKQIWHDFSSGKGGNMFSFVMEMEGVDFRGAMELLARKAGIDLEQYRGARASGTAKLKERLYVASETAAHFYQVQFSKHRPALEYVLGKRQFSKETALEWRLGYSPENGRELMEFLLGRGFTADEIQKAGLSAQRSRGTGDMFRGRLMIPLQDPQGRVVGFTARMLKDDKNAPKYINTPQTLLYDKSRHIFGLHLAKDAIRRSKFVVITEGNLDVISSHQAGVRQVVATAGTALTEYNLKALSRFTDDVRLSFDADRAGIAATERAIPIASKVGVTLGIVTIPSGKDPDELIRQDKSIWERIIGEHEYALDWLFKRYTSALDLNSAVGKRQFSDILLPIVRKLTDSVEQDHYVNRMAELLDVSREALSDKLQKVQAEPVKELKNLPTRTEIDKAKRDYLRIQEHLLALLLVYPKLRPHAHLLRTEMLITENSRQLFTLLAENPTFSGDIAELSSISEPEKVQELTEYCNILLLQHNSLYGDVEDLELDYEVSRLQASLIKQYAETTTNKLKAQLTGASQEQTRDILTRVNYLNLLLKQTQGAQRG